MTPAETRKAIGIAARAYDRAMRATTCSIASTNVRLGQQWHRRADDGVRQHVPAKLHGRKYSPVERELLDQSALLPNAEMEAHLHRLALCGVTQLQHERQAAYARAKDADAVDRARDRQERKRHKKRRR